MSIINLHDDEFLCNYLVSNIPDISLPIEVTKFKNGQSNPTYLLKSENKKYVLRTKPPGSLLKSAHQVDREYRVMKALALSDVPVPKVYCLSEGGRPDQQMFFVMEYLDGRIFFDPALGELDGAASTESKPDQKSLKSYSALQQRGLIHDAMCMALAQLHSVDIDAVGLGDFGPRGNFYERQLSRWHKQYLASETEPYPDMHRLIVWLEKHLPADDGTIALVHGDFRLDNMIFAKDSTEIIGIIDWELSTIGHPFSDLAYQCMQWRLPYRGDFRGLGGVDRKALGIPSESEYIASYCRHRGLSGIDNWNFYLAFSYFRLAAILQGVYKRYHDGNASNPEKARNYGAAVPVLAELANRLIDGKD